MKYILSIALLLSTIGSLSSQNLLSSLYNLEPFPEDMEWAKTFIDPLGDDTLIYNFIGGSGQRGTGNFQFDLRSKNGLDIKLPVTDQVRLLIYDSTSSELSKEASFYFTYKFILTAYQDLDDPLTQTDFSLKNIFNLALLYHELDAYSLVHRVLLNYESELEGDSKRIEFFNQLAQALEIEDVDFKQISVDLTAENYTQREIEEALLDHILEEVDDYEQLTAVIYETFLEPLGEEEKISQKMDRIFYDDSVVLKIEQEVLQPSIEMISSEKMSLRISETYVIQDKESIGSFVFDQMTISIDFKNQHIIAEFENDNSQNITFHDSVELPANLSSNSINVKNIKVVITKNQLTYEFMPYSGSYIKVDPVIIQGSR